MTGTIPDWTGTHTPRTRYYYARALRTGLPPSRRPFLPRGWTTRIYGERHARFCLLAGRRRRAVRFPCWFVMRTNTLLLAAATPTPLYFKPGSTCPLLLLLAGFCTRFCIRSCTLHATSSYVSCMQSGPYCLHAPATTRMAATVAAATNAR
jgi:hypothetical protein